METDNELYGIFKLINDTEYNIFDLASIFWDDDEVSSLKQVESWPDLIKVDVQNVGDSGIGYLLSFMDGNMSFAYLPAWLYFARRNPHPFANIVMSLIAVLDPDLQIEDIEKERFQCLKSDLNEEQKLFIADTLSLIAKRDFKSGTEFFERVRHLAEVWRGLV
ncbi:hypothetical protein [Mesorhizobium sp. SP-1A]|uniref:hypothetical protein n=1 Tax=Mesorhizobium sp. SP-1A TaxID=3077840 RepID=UPI0028F73CDC|nr:hypothetical protein [Mesorhizobium sp. SP-1A]